MTIMGDDKVKKDFLESFLEKLEILSISIFIFWLSSPIYWHPVNLLTFADITKEISVNLLKCLGDDNGWR